jgi:hypothetical protein
MIRYFLRKTARETADRKTRIVEAGNQEKR